MNKVCEIMKIREKYEKKKKYYELKSLIHGKVTEFCIHRYSSNMVKFTKLKHFHRKAKKISIRNIHTVNIDGKDILRKK